MIVRRMAEAGASSLHPAVRVIRGIQYEIRLAFFFDLEQSDLGQRPLVSLPHPPVPYPKNEYRLLPKHRLAITYPKYQQIGSDKV